MAVESAYSQVKTFSVSSLRSNAISYVLPILAMVVLATLLTTTLMRLAEIQREMRNNTQANITWVIYQVHLESVLLSKEIGSVMAKEERLERVRFRYKLLLSRLRLLNEGLQVQALQDISSHQEIAEHVAVLNAFEGLANERMEAGVLYSLADALDSFNAFLSRLASKAMAAKWESSGERMDRLRNQVLILIFLLIGVWVSSAFIAIRLLFALRKTREIGQVRRREIELNRRLENERKISDLYRSFGAMVSHQFRNPLAVIDASMQRLIRAGSRMDGDEVARRAERVRSATQRLTHLIDTILNADRFLDQLEANMQTCSLTELVLQVIAEQRALTPQRKIFFAHDVNDAFYVSCDPVLTVQVLINLLNNAVKYSGDDSEVCIVLERKTEVVSCDVRDQGRGISSMDMPHIFKRYFRTWDASDVVGTGIGLYIASELVALQGGTLQVSSERGVGSTFVLSLKAQEQDVTGVLASPQDNCDTGQMSHA